MNEQEQITAALERIEHTLVGSLAGAALRIGRLSPEQKLSYVLDKLVQHQKETLILMKIANIFAEEHVVNKKRDMRWEML